MSPNFLRRIGISVGALSGIALALVFVTSRAQADQWDKTTFLTVDQPTQIQNTYLEPGTYMLKLANSESDRHIVQIFNRDRSHLINTIIAIPSYRLIPTSDTRISYWETPPGTAKAVREWFYPGDYYGEEFRYPTDLRQIAAVTALPALAPQPPPLVQSEVTPAPAPVAAEPEPPAPQALEQAPPAPQEPVEVAQNNPPPLPEAAPEPQPQQPSNDQQTLPQTASPYPLFGLGGLFALGLYAALRLKSIA